MDSEDFATVSLHRPLVHFSLVGSIDGIPVALSKLHVLGFISQVDIPKVGKPDVGPNPSMLGRSWELSDPSQMCVTVPGVEFRAQLLLPVSMRAAFFPPPPFP